MGMGAARESDITAKAIATLKKRMREVFYIVGEVVEGWVAHSDRD